MELIEEIYRIKSLLSENSDPYKIWVASNLESDRGYCVYYLTENNSVIGSVTITDLNKMLNNKDFILLIKNIFPFLINAANEISILGNGFIGLLFGIILIMYISFYMEDQ